MVCATFRFRAEDPWAQPRDCRAGAERRRELADLLRGAMAPELPRLMVDCESLRSPCMGARIHASAARFTLVLPPIRMRQPSRHQCSTAITKILHKISGASFDDSNSGA